MDSLLVGFQPLEVMALELSFVEEAHFMGGLLDKLVIVDDTMEGFSLHPLFEMGGCDQVPFVFLKLDPGDENFECPFAAEVVRSHVFVLVQFIRSLPGFQSFQLRKMSANFHGEVDGFSIVLVLLLLFQHVPIE